MRHACPETYYPCREGCGDEPCRIQASATWAIKYSKRFPVTPERALEVRRETLACLVDVAGMSKEDAEGQVEEVVELAGSLAQHHNIPIEEALEGWRRGESRIAAESAEHAVRRAWRELVLEVGKALHIDKALDWLETRLRR